jgi:hypothetical protein
MSAIKSSFITYIARFFQVQIDFMCDPVNYLPVPVSFLIESGSFIVVLASNFAVTVHFMIDPARFIVNQGNFRAIT